MMSKVVGDSAAENEDSSSYQISVNIAADLDEDGEWYEPYITDLHLCIWQQSWSDELQDIESRQVGKGEGFVLHIGNAMDTGMDMAEACDAHGAEADEYYSAVLDPEMEWREAVTKQFGGGLIETDVLAFTKLVIEPAYRGKHLGLLALLRTMQIFNAGCGLTLIKPWPLQYTSKEFEELEKHGKTSQGWTDRQRKQEFTKLRRYWSRLGFERIGSTDFYAFPHYRPLISIRSLLRKKRTTGTGKSGSAKK
jgi:hypothetical protein